MNNSGWRVSARRKRLWNSLLACFHYKVKISPPSPSKTREVIALWKPPTGCKSQCGKAVYEQGEVKYHYLPWGQELRNREFTWLVLGVGALVKCFVFSTVMAVVIICKAILCPWLYEQWQEVFSEPMDPEIVLSKYEFYPICHHLVSCFCAGLEITQVMN